LTKPFKILIAPNSFKECADATEIASIIQSNLQNRIFQLSSVPLSDGGDGFLRVCKNKFDLSTSHLSCDSFFDGSKWNIEVGLSKDGKTLYLESSDIIGMKKIPVEQRSPGELNTKNFGAVLKSIQKDFSGIAKIVIGLGGTATNDLGLGLASVFGVQMSVGATLFNEIHPQEYQNITSFVLPSKQVSPKIEIISDVSVPLTGKFGTSKMFASQKGATDEMIAKLEKGVTHVLSLLKGEANLDYRNLNYGAGGGLLVGFSLIFENIAVKYADEFLSSDLNLENEVKSADYIITGEGSFDTQSLQKKATGVLLRLAEKYEKIVFLISGQSLGTIQKHSFANVQFYSLEELAGSKKDAILNYKANINSVCKEITAHVLSHS